MPTDAESKLAHLVAQVERHRESIREFGLAGYITMVERHQKLLELAYGEIRRLCREHDLDLPAGVPQNGE
jgi:hypothetical protein